MENIKFLDLFKNAIGNDKAGNIIIQEGQMPYVEYSEFVNEFINYFYNSDLQDYDYQNNLNKINNLEIIDNKTPSELRTILTYIIRKERFSTGTLLKNIKSGYLHAILFELNKN